MVWIWRAGRSTCTDHWIASPSFAKSLSRSLVPMAGKKDWRKVVITQGACSWHGQTNALCWCLMWNFMDWQWQTWIEKTCVAWLVRQLRARDRCWSHSGGNPWRGVAAPGCSTGARTDSAQYFRGCVRFRFPWKNWKIHMEHQSEWMYDSFGGCDTEAYVIDDTRTHRGVYNVVNISQTILVCTHACISRQEHCIMPCCLPFAPTE